MRKKTAIFFASFLIFGFFGVSAASAEMATSTDTTSPVISGVSATSTTATSTQIVWTTDEPADGQAEYGTTTVYGLLSSLQMATTTSHQVGLSGLTASTTYHYIVKSRDAVGNLATSTDYAFTTLVAPAPPATTTPPVGEVNVRVKFEPKTLNAHAKGRWVEVDVAFPEGYNARDVDAASIRLNSALAPERVKAKKRKLELKFSRAAAVELLSAVATTTDLSTSSSTRRFILKDIVISGKIGGNIFRGMTFVRLLIPADIADIIVFKKERHEEEHLPKNIVTSTANLVPANNQSTTTPVNFLPIIAPPRQQKSEETGNWLKRLFQFDKKSKHKN